MCPKHLMKVESTVYRRLGAVHRLLQYQPIGNLVPGIGEGDFMGNNNTLFSLLTAAAILSVSQTAAADSIAFNELTGHYKSTPVRGQKLWDAYKGAGEPYVGPF